MSSSVRDFISKTWTRLSLLRGPLRLLVIALIFLVVLIFLFFIVERTFYYFIARSYVDEVAAVLGLSKHISTAITWIAFAVIVLFAGYAFSFSKIKRYIGIFGVLGLVVGQSLVLWYGTRDQFFDRGGNAIKCYIITRDAIEYREQSGIDPKTGRECRPITPEIVERLEKYREGNRPKPVETQDDPVFFDLRTGNPVVWYYRDRTGQVELFDLMGFHPSTGAELLPITKEIVDVWKAQKILAARVAPKRIYPDDNYNFFDIITGKPRVWYQKNQNGEYEFYDHPGFSALSGEPFSIITREVVDAWKTDVTSKKCYILTKDSVRYGTNPGIDHITGRQCRPYSPELLARLREYEKGNRPKPITVSDPVFFDLRSGEPIVWFWEDAKGTIELFDLMGFHPRTGDELLPITREVVNKWQEQRNKVPSRAPQRVDPKTFVFFDQITGSPRAWYWKSDQGEFEFYDGPGFHPRTGDPLLIVTKELLVQWQKDVQKQVDDALAAANRDAADKTAAAAAAAQRAAARDAERAQRNEVAKRCDQLAANPTDLNRVGEGVPFDVLKSQAKDAIDACELAANQLPNELRFQYQLARSLSWSDRPRALRIYQSLATKRYPASYDNLGWIFYSDKNDPASAVGYFRRGVELGDPDSMLSLAEMIERNVAVPRDRSEAKSQLYSRACGLGSDRGCKAYEIEKQTTAQEESQRTRDLQQQQRVLELFGTIIQNMPRR